MSRPEHLAPPELFYNDSEASKYTSSSRIQSIQSEMALRCLELLSLPVDPSTGEPLPQMILDIGCGSGLSGEVIEEQGHEWVGMDISGSMLEVALDREVGGDLMLHDIGLGLPFRPGSFDGVVSVSVLQWLCNADAATHNPASRLQAFFGTLFAGMKRGARAALQWYPECDDQVRFVMGHAMKAGFGGGLVVDYPNSQKAKKFYLVLLTGPSTSSSLPKALGVSDSDPSTVPYSTKRDRSSASRKSKGARGKGDAETKKAWIERKKEIYRKRGKEDVPRDSKFTGRKRRTQF